MDAPRVLRSRSASRSAAANRPAIVGRMTESSQGHWLPECAYAPTREGPRGHGIALLHGASLLTERATAGDVAPSRAERLGRVSPEERVQVMTTDATASSDVDLLLRTLGDSMWRRSRG